MFRKDCDEMNYHVSRYGVIEGQKVPFGCVKCKIDFYDLKKWLAHISYHARKSELEQKRG